MVIAYLRVSTHKQHLDNQKDEIERYALNNGIQIDRWVTEVVSGKKSTRERELGKLLKKMKGGETILVTELSRLSRTLHEVMAIMAVCLEKGITIYSTKDGFSFDDSINSKVLSFAFGLVAEIEHKLISQRTKEALAHRRSEGIILGRRAGSSPKIKLLNDNQNDIVNRLSLGHSQAQICRDYKVSVTTFKVFLSQL